MTALSQQEGSCCVVTDRAQCLTFFNFARSLFENSVYQQLASRLTPDFSKFAAHNFHNETETLILASVQRSPTENLGFWCSCGCLSRCFMPVGVHTKVRTFLAKCCSAVKWSMLRTLSVVLLRSPRTYPSCGLFQSEFFLCVCVGGAAWLEPSSPVPHRRRHNEREEGERRAVLRKDRCVLGETMPYPSLNHVAQTEEQPKDY